MHTFVSRIGPEELGKKKPGIGLVATAQPPAKCMAAAAEVSLARIAAHRGVVGYIVINPRDGTVLRHRGFVDGKEVERHASCVNAFVGSARAVVRDLDPLNDLTFLRLRSDTHEVIVAPGDKDFVLVVLQNCTVEGDDATVEQMLHRSIAEMAHTDDDQDADEDEL